MQSMFEKIIGSNTSGYFEQKISSSVSRAKGALKCMKILNKNEILLQILCVSHRKIWVAPCDIVTEVPRINKTSF